ncbi:MAG: hypothetical protein WCK05_08975 [Planctomycetota bacterium]
MIVHCPSCGRAHQAADSLSGQRVRCTECQHIFVVVQEDTAPSGSPAGGAGNLLHDEPASPSEPVPASARTSRPALSALRGESPRVLGQTGSARVLRVARLLVLGGLAFVVLARGLETITVRGASRLQAKAALEPALFDEAWADRLEAGTKDLREPERGKQRKELSDKRDAERTELSETDWRGLKRAADHAVDRGRIRIYWLEWLFLLGALALTTGLIAVAGLGAGPERVICLVMIGVITFSLFVGGTAWLTGFRLGP